jgi:hypothetical protein
LPEFDKIEKKYILAQKVPESQKVRSKMFHKIGSWNICGSWNKCFFRENSPKKYKDNYEDVFDTNGKWASGSLRRVLRK